MTRLARAARLLGAVLITACVAANAAQPVAAPENRRSEDQTFLTFPEWFLVHSPAEYARFVQGHTASDFPFWGHIGQLWSSYKAVTDATAHYDFNIPYHVMITVISVSTTIEYALRSAYETLIGRLSEATMTHGLSAEDRYGATVAADYVDFIRVRPWYEYDFAGKLAGLWRDVDAYGPDLIRKWERRYALTTEYAVKAVYGWLIGLGTQASYGAELTVTAVVIDRLPTGGELKLAELKPQQQLADGAWLATVPRYEAFKTYATALAADGVAFREIAGNGPQAPILISVLAPQAWQPSLISARVLFEQPILTQVARKRVAVVVAVAELSLMLRLLGRDVELEHIYDY